MSITPETYRHWKKALAPLQRGRGHSPCFTSGDLVAVAVIRSLTDDLAVRVGALADIAKQLFELCNLSPWPVLERAVVLIDLPDGRLQLGPELMEITSDRPTITIPLRPIIAELREQLLAASDVEVQASLRFPPLPVGTAMTAKGGRS